MVNTGFHLKSNKRCIPLKMLSRRLFIKLFSLLRMFDIEKLRLLFVLLLVDEEARRWLGLK